ncbi:MAG: 2-hydroxyacyl-CoA dehydratase [Thermoleophilia bacterium]|nr:2-hydroxyacyl-CoA dehydratase [Thermoleophilia bacterium]
MPYCYYTCNLVPLGLLARNGYTPRWLGGYLRDPAAPARRDALAVHPMTCPYVTKLVAAADELFAAAPGRDAAPGAEAGPAADATQRDILVVPGGCDAARRLGDLLAANYPDRVFVLPMPRSSGPEVVKTLAADLRRLEDWLRERLPNAPSREEPPRGVPVGTQSSAPQTDCYAPALDYPSPPRQGGVFVVAGPLTDDSLLGLIETLGAHVSGLEACTSPERWRPLAAAASVTAASGAEGEAALPVAPLDHEALTARLLDIGMCPRRSTTHRRDHLARRLDQNRPSSIIYARQSFCDPGAYDALLVAELAKERGLPYLEIEVDFPFDANGPLRTRVEAFLEAQLLDDDLLGDGLDDELGDGLFDHAAGCGADGPERVATGPSGEES